VTRLGARVPTAIFLILLTVAPVAAAETPVLPEEFSAADQYVESVPTSSGPKSTREAKRKRARVQEDLPPAPAPPAVDELEGKLKEVATSPDLGAPERALRNAPADAPSVPSATVSAVDDADGGRLLWLLLALVVVSGAIAGTASYRHRARRRATDT
jgi:hypothetical protein